MSLGLQILCWFSLAALMYIFAGYPVIVWMCAKLRRYTFKKQNSPRSVSIVIVAHNEAKTLSRKIDSLLACRNSEWIEQILIGSDGSTDDMVNVIRSHSDNRVRAVEYTIRRGKPAVLNDLVP